MPYGPHPSEGQPRSFREARAKRVRIVVELTMAERDELGRWLSQASTELGPGRATTAAQAIKAMIRATAADRAVSDVVLDALRADQS